MKPRRFFFAAIAELHTQTLPVARCDFWRRFPLPILFLRPDAGRIIAALAAVVTALLLAWAIWQPVTRANEAGPGMPSSSLSHSPQTSSTTAAAGEVA